MRFDFNVDLTGGKRLGPELIQSLYLNRIKAKKPANTFLAGDSGEGKTWGCLRKVEILAEAQEHDLNVIAENCIVYTPFEYASKYKWLLKKKESKSYNEFIFMEARELVNAKDWQTTINRVISDVNAMARQIKRIMLWVISQDIGDVDKGVRKTINYYGVCERPLKGNTTIYFSKLRRGGYIDNPKTYQRIIKGLVKTESGYETIKVPALIMGKPSKDFAKRVDELDLKAKSEIIFPKLEELDRQLKKQLPKSSKLERLADIITKDQSVSKMIIKRSRSGKIKLKRYVPEMYSLTRKESKELEGMIHRNLVKTGVIKDETGQSESMEKEE